MILRDDKATKFGVIDDLAEDNLERIRQWWKFPNQTGSYTEIKLVTGRNGILYLDQYLLQHSDQEHPESTLDLARMLAQVYGIKTARNTISNDLTILVNSGLHIEGFSADLLLYLYAEL